MSFTIYQLYHTSAFLMYVFTTSSIMSITIPNAAAAFKKFDPGHLKYLTVWNLVKCCCHGKQFGTYRVFHIKSIIFDYVLKHKLCAQSDGILLYYQCTNKFVKLFRMRVTGPLLVAENIYSPNQYCSYFYLYGTPYRYRGRYRWVVSHSVCFSTVENTDVLCSTSM
ncbi:unnamed protein product [Xylocopa violacea]|uniref:Uncharacterized protein n=1 Tax=Xylocopa violacea TaxID=135666 RepID=A0ABP1P4X8_XYLVO